MGESGKKNLTPMQKKILMAAGGLQISLFAAAQWDIRRRPADQIKGPKLLWRTVAFLNFVGPAGYFIFGRQKPTPRAQDRTAADAA